MRGACVKPRRFIVIIAEKPKAGEKIALALGRPVKCRVRGVPYWVLKRGGDTIVVAASAGHLFGPATRERGFPVFAFEWLPLWLHDKDSRYLKKFYDALSRLVPGAVLYVNACDYDIEGSVIGYKIIEALGDVKRAMRMKFSSLSSSELREAYSKLRPLDWNMIEAGMARSEMDWLWGINISRALMKAARLSLGRKISLSAGRVQSPTLVEAVRRWEKANLHLPIPSISLEVTVVKNGATIVFRPAGWRPSNSREAYRIKRDLLGAGYLKVASYTEREDLVKPPPAFNLGDLQAEASRIYGIPPMKTQSIAESLYLDALISYPRTNSQKLPPTIDYRSILAMMASIPKYSSLVSALLRETGGRLSPVQGKKDDPAHPAIYPTGAKPGRLSRDEERIYDLIVRRFLAAFADSAKILRVDIVAVDHGGRKYVARGLIVSREGWYRYYPFSKPKEGLIPRLLRDERLPVRSVSIKVEWAPPQAGLTKLSLLKWMESVNIGTESTRARIIETLFKRGYLVEKDGKTVVTDLGYTVSQIIRELFPQLATPELTRGFEEMLEDIRRGRRRRSEVIRETIRTLSRLLEDFERSLPMTVDKLATILNPERAGQRCSMKGCPWPATASKGSVMLCERHQKALAVLREKVDYVAEILGVDREWALREIVRRRGVVGPWILDVAREAVRDPDLLR